MLAAPEPPGLHIGEVDRAEMLGREEGLHLHHEHLTSHHHGGNGGQYTHLEGHSRTCCGISSIVIEFLSWLPVVGRIVPLNPKTSLS